MKAMARSGLEWCQRAIAAPLLLLLVLTSERSLIWADVRRWSEVLALKEPGDFVSLLWLLATYPEFRNLFYHRIDKGNLAARLWLWFFKAIYRESPTLFIDRSCSIGPGLFLQHAFSTIIMANIGANGWINQQVTIGYKDRSGRPTLGDNVRVTAGAKILGPIHLGHNVTVGANAVVVKDVADDCVVGGIPARILKCRGIKVTDSDPWGGEGLPHGVG